MSIRFSPGGRAGACAAVATLVGIGAIVQPTQAIHVYVMSSGNATLDSAVQSTLSSSGHSSTLGQAFWQFDGTQSLAPFDAVYMQVSYNWTGGDMPEGGQLALRNWLQQGGGGLVTSEWAVYKAASGDFQTLGPLFAAEAFSPAPGFDPRLTAGPLTFEQLIADPVLSDGLPASFTFPVDDLSGTLIECFPRLGTEAVQFYQARTPSSFTTCALAGREVGAGGRTVNLGVLAGPVEIGDANLSRLLVNALQWASAGEAQPGTDLSLHAVAASTCAVIDAPLIYSLHVSNFGAQPSGPVTLTVDLPPASLAAYANAIPAPATVTPATLTFDLSPLDGGAFVDVSITLTAVGEGAASITATATTTADVDPGNNGAMASTDILDLPAVHLEVGDAPELAGGQATGIGQLTAIEGSLDGNEADMYLIRVDDWTRFTASTADNPSALGMCGGGAPFSDTALFLFDSSGQGIAFNDNTLGGQRAVLATGDPAYVGRVNGEVVWLAVSGRDYDAISFDPGVEIWADAPRISTRTPDGPGAAGTVEGWSGSYSGRGTYRISLSGVSTGVDLPGVDLEVEADPMPDCAFTGSSVAHSIRIWNFGTDTSGPVTLTVDLPSEAIAVYSEASPQPASVTPTTLTFHLSPLAGGGAFADVSVTLTVVGGGPASITVTATTTFDVDPENNTVVSFAEAVVTPVSLHLEAGDAPELAGGQVIVGSVTGIEGTLTRNDADMYSIRVDDWAAFTASTADGPSTIPICGGPFPFTDTALFLFDSRGRGISFNEDSAANRAVLAAGDPTYAGRTNGEIVWLVVSGRDYDPTSGGAEIWTDEPRRSIRAPDGPGAGGAIDGWGGSYSTSGGDGTYRISLAGVSAGVLHAGTDLLVQAKAESTCALPDEPIVYSVQVWNFGTDPSGPVTLTVDLPSGDLATYAEALPAPTSVTPTTLTFDLDPLAGGVALVDLSITLTAAGGGTASIATTATTTSDIDPANNAAIASTDILDPPTVHLEVGDASDLAGGQTTGAGVLTAIEGALAEHEADMYSLRVDNWATFMASTAEDPSILAMCGGAPLDDTALFLFDSSGRGIAFVEDSVGGRAVLAAGSSAYSGRANGETVWLAISGFGYDATSGGAEIWMDSPWDLVRAPDGPGAAGTVDGWSGSHGSGGLYRISLSGVSAVGACSGDVDGSGTVDVFDLLAYLGLWFAGDAAADIDGTPGIDVFDLLTYLNTWFAGC